MLVLTIRTDNPEAEIGLFRGAQARDEHADGAPMADHQVAYETWTAHRQLAETLHAKIRDMLSTRGYQFRDITAIACYAGPGSFTGLRIGLSVGNALAYSLQVPIVATTNATTETAASTPGITDSSWRTAALQRLADGQSDPVAMPFYGAEANITAPKH